MRASWWSSGVVECGVDRRRQRRWTRWRRTTTEAVSLRIQHRTTRCGHGGGGLDVPPCHAAAMAVLPTRPAHGAQFGCHDGLATASNVASLLQGALCRSSRAGATACRQPIPNQGLGCPLTGEADGWILCEPPAARCASTPSSRLVRALAVSKGARCRPRRWTSHLPPSRCPRLPSIHLELSPMC
jgi:hypothetical protein